MPKLKEKEMFKNKKLMKEVAKVNTYVEMSTKDAALNESMGTTTVNDLSMEEITDKATMLITMAIADHFPNVKTRDAKTISMFVSKCLIKANLERQIAAAKELGELSYKVETCKNIKNAVELKLITQAQADVMLKELI